ncbi:MAG: glycoside hydrolase family 3 protein [Chlorobium sp.]|uniref:glycoside hydrolase family 3 protein n=1 Tax=Chlorobium sp. TaxID=1095 RepID=UPI002F42A591
MKPPTVLAALLLLTLFPGQTLQASARADSLSIKIGQMLMIGFRGMTVDDAPEIVGDIRSRHIGGVVLFDYDMPLKSPVRNIGSREQLSKLTTGLQQLSDIPLFIAIDQEGGKVNRLKASKGFPQSVSAAHLGMLDNPDSTEAAARKTAATMKSMCMNMNLAPVLDLNVNPDNPVIGRLGRSYSADPAIVARHAMLTAAAFREEGIIPVFKHFPGHGSSETDTHKDFTDVTGSWTEKELEPYRAMIDAGYNDAVMTAHVFNRKLDSRFPATLSKKVLDDRLRQQLGFGGVILSDDMQMQAIAGHYGLEKAVRLAVEAGVDILLFGNNTAYDPDIAEKASSILHRLVKEGTISKARIDRSYHRIMKLKERFIYYCK